MQDSVIQEILTYVRENRKYLDINFKLFEIYNNKIKKHIEDRIIFETQTENARKQILARLSPINILTKVIGKLSKVYLQDVKRKNKHDDANAQENLQNFIDEFEFDVSLDSVMQKANELYNLNHCVAIEVNNIDGKNIIRVLPAHTFLPFSNHAEDHTIMTHFVKIIEKDWYVIYDEEEYIELKEGEKVDSGLHGAGRIPFVYINSNQFLLKPYEDEETLDMTLLLPLMLTDLNFALRFQSHSIVYGVNVDAKNLEMTPNSFWSFKSTGVEGDKPELGTIKPDVDSEKMLSTVQTQFSLWLDTKNIKTYGFAPEGRQLANISGISKAIDNADVTDEIEKQIEVFKKAEYELFDLVKIMYNNKILASYPETVEVIPEEFCPIIIFTRKSEIIETKREKLETEILKLENSLTSRRKVLSVLNPDYTDAEIDNLLEEIDNENIDDNKNSLEDVGTEVLNGNSNTNSSQNTAGVSRVNESQNSQSDN